MNYQHSSVRKPAAHSEYDYAAAEDARLQADPELAAAEGRASPLLIAGYFAAMVFFVCLVLYGVNNSRNESVETAAAPATQSQRAAPPAPQQQTSAASQQPTPAPKQ